MALIKDRLLCRLRLHAFFLQDAFHSHHQGFDRHPALGLGAGELGEAQQPCVAGHLHDQYRGRLDVRLVDERDKLFDPHLSHIEFGTGNS